MSEELFVVGDFSGIQDYVLSVSSLGGGQARRLRARSFFIQAAEEIAAHAVLDGFEVSWDDGVIFHGGGRFLLRLPAAAEAEEKLSQLRKDLESSLHRETQAGLCLTLAWGRSLDEALRRKEHEKRRPWALTVAGDDGWHVANLALDSLTPRPCAICSRKAADKTLLEDEAEIQVCSRCHDDTKIGQVLPQPGRFEIADDGGFSVLGRGLRFHAGASPPSPHALQTPNLYVPAGMTFKEIADNACGDNRLVVLKADVDSMGAKLGERRHNPEELKKFSRDLDDFFSRQVQEKLRGDPWQPIYTIYSGGDDLLVVGPWNLALDFAGEVCREFAAGPGNRYGLTFSAGIALTDYHVPIRHAVEQADELLECAKGRAKAGCPLLAIPPKNACAALGSVWKWDRHETILDEAKRLKSWIEEGVCPRSMAHRLLSLAEGADPLRTAHWAYEVGRNFPRSNAATDQGRAFRAWGEKVLAEILENPAATRELAVELRYALIATRPRRESP
ncbi:MAG TPA: hypothetical protein VFZ08_06875 [Terriglobia bacterium]|nr:hypothetical protein [Terriglobia bacterium]